MSLAAAPDNLRGHILYGPAEAVGSALPTAELLGQSEVGEHYVALRVEENVLQFDITIDDPELCEKKWRLE